MVQVVGVRLFGDRLRRLSSDAAKEPIVAAVGLGADMIKVYAKESIIAGGVSGPNHVASSPGDPPNADTHALDQSIHVEQDLGSSTIFAKVVADDPAAAPMEFGTSTVAARPFMRPASQAVRPQARQLIVDATNKMIADSKG